MADDTLSIQPGLDIQESEIRYRFARSGGPGGQNVNKVETKVEVRINIRQSLAFDEAQRERLLQRLGSRLTTDGDLIVTSDRHRSRERNRADALSKLAEILRSSLQRPKRRRQTRPTRASVERRIDQKRRRSNVKRGRKGED